MIIKMIGVIDSSTRFEDSIRTKKTIRRSLSEQPHNWRVHRTC